MKNTYYVTSPIYYVNDVPHIGHAYTTLACDVLARFMRLDGREVKFLTGTDEHGQKVEKSAEKAGLLPQAFTDQVSQRFRELFSTMNISNDDFIRTTEERHKKAAQSLWNKLIASGNIYLSKYSGWYSVRDEAFYNESELIEGGLAPTGAPVEWVEEPSYFFKLSAWQDKLLELYENNPGFIKPESRRNEVISFVKGGLTDLSVSRTSFKWGVPVPGDESHVMYVWLDALTNYISALGYPDEEAEEFKKFWPADVHIMGKDITRFHAVYWPAFLMAAGLEVPKSIMAHGWWTNEGQKISKSVGNVIDPFKLIEEFGLDQTRYFLMREVIFGNDGNYARANMINRINSELANNIGNLVQRTLSFVAKNAEGKVPEVSAAFVEEAYKGGLLELASVWREKAQVYMDDQNYNAVLDEIIKLASQANIFIDHEAPWNLRKTDLGRMNEVLYVLLETIRYIGITLQPFIPESASKILDSLAISQGERSFATLSKRYALRPGIKLPTPEPIFPRYQEA
ncbi:MAG: methionyl-tRNA synthetase [Rickettsiaceae bacterium]|jgi:methionyl-tRNA synthetase|nr:methionyl-tRNA synthetase [Rickettsiaceae bacterium]